MTANGHHKIGSSIYTVEQVLDHLTGENSTNWNERVEIRILLPDNSRSYWSETAQILLDWNSEDDRRRFPARMFAKIPIVSTNHDANYDAAVMRRVLRELTEYEILFYRTFPIGGVPGFPYPKVIFAADPPPVELDKGDGILILEDVGTASYSGEYIPGYTIAQVETLSKSLAAFHHYLSTRNDWQQRFGRIAELDPDFVENQLECAKRLEEIAPQLFAGKVAKIERIYTCAYAEKAYTCYDELEIPPALVHQDMNISNVMWRQGTEAELVSVIDFQLCHTGNPLEDLCRIVLIGLPAEDRHKNERRFVDIYHAERTRLNDGVEPFSRQKAYDAYDRILPFCVIFGLFGVASYWDLYDKLAADDEKAKASARAELLDRGRHMIDDCISILSQNP